MWSLYEEDKELKPLCFSNGKTQEDVVKEVLDLIKDGNKIIFIRGMCGTGKSAIALNLARKLGKSSIVVPIKSLQEQYTKDYTGKKYLLHNGKKMKICSVFGRQNFKCRFLQENEFDFERKKLKEKNSSLTDIFSINKINFEKKKNDSCDNDLLPCKIEIKEKNMDILKNYIKLNPDVRLSDFDSISDISRMTIAPVCPYWSPTIPEDLDLKKFKDIKKVTYQGLNNRRFSYYERKPGCKYYEQYKGYHDSDVLIFNSLKYKIETIMDRKPLTEVEIIDECDDFLDSFANEEQINLNRFLFSLNSIAFKDEKSKELIDSLTDLSNSIKANKKYKESTSENFYEARSTPIEELLNIILKNSWILDLIENEESSYLNHMLEVSRLFEDFLDETFFSIENKDNNMIINLVTINLEKRFKEMMEKNKVFIMMSGTLHSESVLKNIFGINNFKIVEAETAKQGELIKCKTGLEKDCSYSNFQSKNITREYYLNSLSKCIDSAKRPTLVHVNSFSDLPTEHEKTLYSIFNLPSQEELYKEQSEDPLGNRIRIFREKKTDILFTTKCNRGVDFPGDICNSIVITRFPYPNISSIFWKILKKVKPGYFMTFYMDKAKRELLQKVYRGLRSKEDKVYLLSPDLRVLNFEF